MQKKLYCALALLVAGCLTLLAPVHGQVPDDVPLKTTVAEQNKLKQSSGANIQLQSESTLASGMLRTEFGEDGPDVNVSNLVGNEAEVSIAVNPTNRDNLVIAGHAPGFNTMNTFYSMDGGETWTLVALGDDEDGFTSAFRFDPTVTIAGDGNVYVGYGLDDDEGNRHLVVARSTDGGVSYDQFTTVESDNSLDKWIIGSGPDATTPGQFNVYFAYRITESGNVNVRLASSYDQGATFSVDERVNDGGSLNTFGMPAVGPNGEVYVVWDDQSNEPTSSTIKVDVSTDNGSTFGSDNDVSMTPVTRGNSNRYDISAAPSRGVLAVPSIAVDRSGGPNDGRVYVAYTTKGSGGFDDTDVALRFSDDQGSTWSSEMIVNDDGGTTSQFLPWLDVDQETGQVVVVWYDTRNDPTDNEEAEVFLGVSNDGGSTIEPNILVSDGASDESGNWGNDYLEYIGVASRGGVAFPVWADNSVTSDLDFFTDPIPIGDPPVADAGADQTVECLTTSGTTVTLDASGSSDPNGDALTYTWRENSTIIAGPTTDATVDVTLERGSHTIELTVDDGNLLADTDEVVITVEDTEPPAITLDGDSEITLVCGIDEYSELGATVSDACDPDPDLLTDNTAVDPDTPGTYTVTYTATDEAGNTSTAERTVNVVDATPPAITVNSDPITLWPPDHDYQTVNLNDLDIEVTDECDETVTAADVAITQVWSDEEEDARGGGDGFTSDDIVIDEGTCRAVDLRAERLGGGDGRVYTLTLEVADAAGNVGNTTFQAHVPNDIDSGPLGVDDGQVFTVAAPTCEPVSPAIASGDGTDSDQSDPGDEAKLEGPRAPKTTIDQVDRYELSANHPNPFDPVTEIRFALPEAQHVRLVVYDMLGRTVDELVDAPLSRGWHTVRFDGRSLPSGTYFYRIEAGSFVQTRRMTMVR